jgi:hypothetical protein
MRCGFETHALLQVGVDMTQVILEKRSAVPDYGAQFGLAFAARHRHGGQAVVAPYQISAEWLLPIGR